MKIILENYSNYEIYPNDGKIWSIKSKKYIGSNNDGYINCTLFDDNGKRWSSNLHRVIYTAVYGEIPNGYQVNHIDENTLNNSISNLNLMTPKENSNYGSRNEKIKNKNTNGKCSKGVVGLKYNKVVLSFKSINEAERNGFNHSHIISCCCGKRKTHKGYEWKYIEKVA